MNLGVDHPKAAVVAIDLHRGHLDMDVATMPMAPDGAERVITANRRPFDWCRDAGFPVIHCVTGYRDAAEIRANAFWRTRAEEPQGTRKNVMRHNLLGGPGCTVMPQLYDAGRDWVVGTKKRYDSFGDGAEDLTATGRRFDVADPHLQMPLALRTAADEGRSQGHHDRRRRCFRLGQGAIPKCLADLQGMAANVRDYAVIVVEDCVDTMDGPALHEAGLLCIRTAFGFVLDTAAVMQIEALRPKDGL